MTQEPLIWIVLIVAVALVLGLIVWKGRGMRLTKNQNGFSLKVDNATEKTPPSNQSSAVSVAKEIEIEKARVGDIAGIKSDSGQSIDSGGQNIEVASGARIKDAEVGDIVGVKSESKNKK